MSRARAAGAGFVAGALCVAVLWFAFGRPEAEIVPVAVVEARLVDSENGTIELLVDSCNGAPKATGNYGSEYFEVLVTAFRKIGEQDDCLEVVQMSTNRSDENPLTELLDLHTGEVVAIAQPG